MFTFEITSYPELPCDFALFGAFEWAASEQEEGASHAEKYPRTLAHLERCCELAGVTVRDLLGMVERGHLALHYERACG